MLKNIIIFSLLVLLPVTLSTASADSGFDKVVAEYPKDTYLVGIGEVSKGDNFLRDKRAAEVLARLEIAKQIKVRLKEETLDIMCEGVSVKLFKDLRECKNEFVMIVEVTVDEFLKGSRIVSHGEKDGTIYAVAIMPKAEAVKDLDNKARESIDKTKENIEKAQKGDKEALNDAQEAYMKAVTYDKEKEMIEGVRSHASSLFEELEKELVKLRESN